MNPVRLIIVAAVLLLIAIFVAAGRRWLRGEQPCRVYWGHAGCELPRGHDGPHTDLPGRPPFPREGEGLEFVFGEDWHGELDWPGAPGYEPDVLMLPAAATQPELEPAQEWEPDGRLAQWGGTDQHQLAAIDLSRESWFDRNAALTWDWSRRHDREERAWCDRVLADIRASFGRLAAA